MTAAIVAAAPGKHARQARPLSGGERRAVTVTGVLAAVLGLIGFANSFRAMADAARASFGELAVTVPVGVDLGIAVFSALDIVLARLDLRPRWVRLVPWTLTAATVYLNVTGQHTGFAKVAHAVFPALWVIAVEVAAHVVRVRAGLAAGTAMDRIRPSRWLLAPVPTARLMRRMVLWEIRSYPEALRRERDRLLALTELQDTYGPLAWRWRAPRRTRALYRLGELAPGQRPAAIVPVAAARPCPARTRARAEDRTRRRTRTRAHPHPAPGRTPHPEPPPHPHPHPRPERHQRGRRGALRRRPGRGHGAVGPADQGRAACRPGTAPPRSMTTSRPWPPPGRTRPRELSRSTA